MEATVLSVGKSAVSGALDYAKSAIAQEVALQLGVWRDQVFITDELEMMQGFLRAAHDERDGNMVVKIWVKQVRDVAYDAEDCLMDFAVRLEMQSCWRIPCMLPDRHRVAMEMKELRARVEDVSRRNMRYSLIRGSATSKPGTVAGQSSISSEVLLHIAQATRTAQQQEEKVDLSKLLTNDYDGLRVIAVLGKSSAVGVTSIIRDAYDKCDQFQCRAWVRLIHPFNPHDLFVSLVRQFYKDSCEPSGKSIGVKNTGVEVYKKMLEQEGNLVDEFNRYVTEKRYLVVITDVSTIEEWDWVKTYFPSMNGSRIIVSTQQFEVASLCTEQPCTVSEIDQKWSFDKDFYVFYKKVDDKAESSSKAKSTNAEPANKETGNSTPDSVVAAALEDDQLIDRKNAKDLELIDHSFGEVGDPSKMNDISEPRSNTETGDAEHASKEHADKSTKELARATFEDDQLIDRKKAKADVLKLLKQDGEVIVICGMGGLGKTTLVRSVYQQELGQRFQRQAWLTISHSFNHKEFLVDLFQQLCRDDNDKEGKAATTIKEKFFSKTNKENKSKEEEEEIDKKLLNILSKKTCLIVLDDLSFSKDWKLIGDTLLPSDRNPDNRIIVTTRDAKCCPVDTRQIYNLNELNDDDSLELFEKKVFKDQKERVNYDNNRDMVEQAKLILNKCGGLPLAVSTIGSFLATKPKTAMEWRNLNKHISTELQVNPELEMINTVLVSSYEGLPYHLKLPFLYFSIFPEDRNIRWARLVRRWIAEGYSKEVRDKRAEEIGNSYITDLINRSMIRPSKGTGRRITRRIGFLQIHDLIREITISKSTEENLVFTLHEGCRLNTQEGKVRHLAVSNSWLRDKNAFESAAGNWSHVRSLTVFGGWRSFFISDNMRLLRVLDLEDTEGLENHHLHLIVKLFHLKYLSLRRCGRLLRLPDSLGNLRHLETLDVRDTQIIKMPSTIIKLRKLQYLHVGFIPSYDRKEERGRYRLDLGSLFCCPWECWCCCWPVCLVFSLLGVLLTMLVLLGLAAWVLMKDGFDGLRAEFMGVVIRGVKFPRGIRELKALHTMGVVNIDGDNAIIEDLRYLTDLRKLRVTGLNKKNYKKFGRAIDKLECLESLCVRSEGEPGLSDCVNPMSTPPKSLRSLKLYGHLDKLPWWIEGLRNLEKLELRSSCISKVPAAMKVLGKLPNLSSLRLSVDPFKGEKIHLNFHRGTNEGGIQQAFPSLVLLELYYQSGLESVTFEEKHCPKLELLQFNNSLRSKQPEVGLFSGLQSVKSLKEVQLIGNLEEGFVEGLRRQLPAHSVLKRCQAPN